MILTLLALQSAFGASSFIQDEINRLESLKRLNKITQVQMLELGERYFLTSRCADVRNLFKPHGALPHAPRAAELLCACDGPCVKSAHLSKLSQFRHLLAKGTKWHDPRVAKLWHDLRETPEARYWALKALRTRVLHTPEKKLVAELEKSLESLEVKDEVKN